MYPKFVLPLGSLNTFSSTSVTLQSADIRLLRIFMANNIFLPLFGALLLCLRFLDVDVHGRAWLGLLKLYAKIHFAAFR